MKIPLDIFIINNTPSFYKINLYNELAKHCRIHVVFIALTNQVVINNSFTEDIDFSYDLLSSVQIEKRKKWQSLVQLFKICKRFDYKKIIYGGYNDLEERVFIFLTRKHKNCIQFESSIFESKVTGPISIIKKVILKRFSMALPSGKLQTAVFETLNFKGTIIETKGVGLFNKTKKYQSQRLSKTNQLKYLFVGRLIPVKNIEFLIRVFNKTKKSLTIVGTGILENRLKKQANPNIKFVGFIPNENLPGIYCSHDIFILPSNSETWGLVVEEAIFFGLPVIVSDAVGCQQEMVVQPDTGVVFSLEDEDSMLNSITKLEANIDLYRKNCSQFNFEQRDKQQVEAYLKILNQ